MSARNVGPGRIQGLFVQVLMRACLFLALPVLLHMSPENFATLLRPATLAFLFFGMVSTAVVSTVATLVSVPFATALALGRLSRVAIVRWPCTFVIEIVRAVPLLLLIFYINLYVPDLYLVPGSLSGNYIQTEASRLFSRGAVTMMFALALYTAAVNAELIRSGIRSIAIVQLEAGRSLGMTYIQTMIWIILPQAFRIVAVPILSQFAILIKDTSLGSIIGFVELQRRVQILYQRDLNPLEALYTVAILYFALNYLIRVGMQRLERRRSLEEPVVN